jgi:hypothetical protein
MESKGAVEAAMRPENYGIIFDVEDDHWWFVGRRAVVFAQIEDALGAQASPPAGFQSLDIGCGICVSTARCRGLIWQ